MRTLRAPGFRSLFRADIPQLLFWISVFLLPFVGGAIRKSVSPARGLTLAIAPVQSKASATRAPYSEPSSSSDAQLTSSCSLSFDLLASEQGEEEEFTQDHSVDGPRSALSRQTQSIALKASLDALRGDFFHSLSNPSRAPPQA